MSKVGLRLVEPADGDEADVGLKPSPAICGKTNHIQWDRFSPAASSRTTAA